MIVRSHPANQANYPKGNYGDATMIRGPCFGSDILLDVSRLLYRGVDGRFSGIDRVEFAYAQQLLHRVPGRLQFVASNYRGGIARLSRRGVMDFLDLAAEAWTSGGVRQPRAACLRLLMRSIFSLGYKPRPERGRVAVYLNVSGHPLSHPWTMRHFLRSNHAKFVPLIHDLIPLDHPEFVPPTWTGYHHRRLELARHHAAGVIVTSQTVAAGVKNLLRPGTPMVVSPLGVARRASTSSEIAVDQGTDALPYFVCLGTIEPRKNHLTLLHLWRRLALRLGTCTPRLVIIGRRGWENEQVLDMLDRCPVLRPHVEEHAGLSDAAVQRFLRGARALVMPSFIEGYGLPVVESLAGGTPVICSAIPAHREVGKDVPEFLDPLDLGAWLDAVTDYAAAVSPRREAQLARLHHWAAPEWSEHFDITLRFIDGLTQHAAPGAPEVRAVDTGDLVNA